MLSMQRLKSERISMPEGHTQKDQSQKMGARMLRERRMLRITGSLVTASKIFVSQNNQKKKGKNFAFCECLR
jgi:hypothetical protein